MAKKHQIEVTGPGSTPVLGASRDQGKPVLREQNKSADFFSVYTNDIQLQASPWDLRMILGEAGDVSTGEPATVSIKQLGEVRMSPQLAKMMVRILIGQLRAYEEQFGEIPGSKD